MILQALYNYYQILREDHEVEIAEPDYSNAPVSYALNLSEQGELLDIIPLSVPVQQGKKTVDRPKRMNVPEQVKRSVNVAANFLCDNAAYVLGLTGKEAKDPAYAQKRFEVFRELNIEILKKANSPSARAVIAFLKQHNPQTASQNPVIERHLKGLLEGGNLIFQVRGKNVLDDPEIRRVWEESRTGQQATKMQCLVTGQKEPVARLHPDIKGVPGAQTKGASLVSFNLDAFTSYGKEQGANSPISQRAASGYGVALNYLLSRQNPNRPTFLGDTTVIYWADTADKRYASVFYAFLNPEFQQEQEESEPEENKGKRKRAKEAEKEMGQVAESVRQGKAIDLAALRKGLDESTRFYVLGLAPNASRLAVRFFLTEPFGVFAERIMQHYDDLQIEKEFANQPTYISPYRILAECVSPKVTRRDDEVKQSWSLLGGAFMRAILTGAPYPEGLYAAILNRIRHDSDEEKRSVKINYIRAAYIKAHLIRKFRRQGQNPYQEALQMSLNESYTHPAYVLGRLFAVLEKAQREAIGQNINATIKDRYFTSACASPASVFPTLLRLSHHWTTKAEYGGVSDRKIQDLLGMLPAQPFPSRLSLDEQGVFVLGYYHQRAAFYAKKDNGEEESQPEE
ncbi:type I-C CRISPR-associated protein Cas8c/Csd1 [Roseiflexus sp.]|uniref:type I-C CRISPR-associated protein Cas8c/Csd1 n=1 Tax=Roseiflexus sp. TaxID=2562120 RepID=UPI0021DE91B2|nr:type I-C CRISPR-associated protein Cas8c/Csd1 [Roseiflexus sp.]GIV99948.1 MAG: type I-C CRISPR-associated protein Cas8c/Csd1 [Roseiflexus sp.]